MASNGHSLIHHQNLLVTTQIWKVNHIISYHIIYKVVQAKFQPITMLSNQQKHCEQFAKPYITISSIMSVSS